MANLDRLVELRVLQLLDERYRLLDRQGLRRHLRFGSGELLADTSHGLLRGPNGPGTGPSHQARRGTRGAVALLDDVEPHRPGRPGDGPNRGLERVRVQIGHLRLRNLLDLLGGHRADLGLVRLGRPLGEVRRALQQHGRGGRLRDEAVGAIGVDRDHDRDDEPFLAGRLRVEVLAEIHDVHAVRTERGPHGRRRRRLAGRNLQLHHRLNFLCHNQSRLSPASSQ